MSENVFAHLVDRHYAPLYRFALSLFALSRAHDAAMAARHLYIGRRGDMPGVPAAGKPEFVERAGGAAAVWRSGSFDFAVVSADGLQAVRRIL